MHMHLQYSRPIITAFKQSPLTAAASPQRPHSPPRQQRPPRNISHVSTHQQMTDPRLIQQQRKNDFVNSRLGELSVRASPVQAVRWALRLRERQGSGRRELSNPLSRWHAIPVAGRRVRNRGWDRCGTVRMRLETWSVL